MIARALDLWVFILPTCLPMAVAFVGAAFIFRLSVPRAVGGWFVFMLVGNVLQLATLATLWYRGSLQKDPNDSSAFWGEVLKYHFDMGGALYYFCYLRGWLLRGTDRETYERKFWRSFLRSRATRVVRFVHRVWVRVFVGELAAGWLVAAFRVDVMVEPLLGVVVVTMVLGVLSSSYLEIVLIRDAAIRWKGSTDERIVAMTLFSGSWYSRFRFSWAAEEYFQAVLALQLSRED